MIDVSPEQLEIIKKVLQKHAAECEVRAFGSRATWTAKDYSDLDLVIVGKEKLPGGTIFSLKEAFQESDLPFRVDVLDWHAISKEFRKIIEKKYEVVQKAGDAAKAGEIPEGWKEYIFSEAMDVNPRRELKKGSNVKYVSMADLKAFNRKIQSFTTRAFSGGSKFINGDTLMARITPCLENGKTAFVDILENGEVGCGSTEFIVLCGQDGKSINQFVYYLAISPSIREKAVKSMTGTSGRQRVESDVFDKLAINLPSIAEQRTIAKILGDLDEKIEVNHQMNKTLESIAQALFKQWFVDLEFPGHEKTKFVNGLPEGWEEGSLTDIVDVLGGGTPTTTEPMYWGEELPFFTPRDVSDSCYVMETEKNITLKGLKNCNSQKYSRNTVFITARGTVGKVCMAGSDMAMNQSCYAIRFKNDDTKQYFVYGLIKHLAEQLTRHSHGTVFDTITTETFRKTQAVQPSQNVQELFCAQVGPFYDLILSNMQKNRELSQIRDTLLPKLMTGKIRVEGAGRRVKHEQIRRG